MWEDKNMIITRNEHDKYFSNALMDLEFIEEDRKLVDLKRELFNQTNSLYYDELGWGIDSCERLGIFDSARRIY